MTFAGQPIIYTRENASEMDKQLPKLDALSISSIVTASGLEGLDGIDVSLVHGKRSTYINNDDWLETRGDKQDFTHGDVRITCQGTTNEQIDLNYTRLVGQDTWKTNKGDTIQHYVGELSEVHKADRHLEEPESVFEKMNNKIGWGVARMDMWALSYNLIATLSTTWFHHNFDYRTLDGCLKLGVSEHILSHFADKEADVENKGVEDVNTVGKAQVKPASVEAGAGEAHEIGMTQNLGTVGPNSNI